MYRMNFARTVIVLIGLFIMEETNMATKSKQNPPSTPRSTTIQDDAIALYDILVGLSIEPQRANLLPMCKALTTIYL